MGISKVFKVSVLVLGSAICFSASELWQHQTKAAQCPHCSTLDIFLFEWLRLTHKIDQLGWFKQLNYNVYVYLFICTLICNIYIYVYTVILLYYIHLKGVRAFVATTNGRFLFGQFVKNWFFQPCRNVELAALSRHRLGEVIMLGCFFPSSCVLRIPAFYPWSIHTWHIQPRKMAHIFAMLSFFQFLCI